MSVIKDNYGYHYELDRSRAMLISEEFLTPPPNLDEQEPPRKISAAEGLCQMAKDEMEVENDAQCQTQPRIDNPIEDNGLADMIERDALAKDSLRDMINKEVNWLAYRMDLAKEIAVALIAKGHNIVFVSESTSLIVNGIVERLKGGEK